MSAFQVVTAVSPARQIEMSQTVLEGGPRVGTTARAQPLAGLVSSAAEALFMRLLASSSTRAGITAGETDVDDSAAAELLDLGLAFRLGTNGNHIRPVDQAVALRMLLEQRQAELIAAQRRIIDGWTRLTAMLPCDIGGGGVAGSVDGVLTLNNFDEVMTRAAELYPSAKRRMRGTETGESPTRLARDRRRAAPRSVVTNGARFQMIYQIGYLNTPAGSRFIEDSAQLGEEIRIRPDVPLKMLHVDDAIALVSTDRAAQTALLVRAPAILSMLGEWFDLLWEHSGTMATCVDDDGALTASQRRVLELMAVDGDEAIARRLNMSITTVRRNVKAIYTALGVDNRFAAGVAAAKRGWI